MKRLLKVFAFLGSLGVAGWLLRNRVVAVTMNREPETPRPAPEPAPDDPAASPQGDLTSIQGIGSSDALLLESAGVVTAAQLAEADAAALATRTGIAETHLENWIELAGALSPTGDSSSG